jgi:putative membrane protein
MITYDPKNWLKLGFAYKGTIIPRVLPRVAALVALTFGVFVAREVILWLTAPPKDVPVATAPADPLKPFKPLGHTLIGVALGLLIVFRNNCSYDRYWEGRKLWGGIVNTSRNLMRGAVVAAANHGRELAGLVSAYALALKQHLRSDKDLGEIREHVPPDVFEKAAPAGNPPATIAFSMSRWIAARQAEGKLDPFTAQGLEQQVRLLLDNQGGCERILRTPIPFAYAVHIKQLLFLYLLSLPFVLVGEMGWVAIPTTAAIAFGLLGIEEAGVEIEDPFGDDPNDLPIETICATIGRDAKAAAEMA